MGDARARRRSRWGRRPVRDTARPRDSWPALARRSGTPLRGPLDLPSKEGAGFYQDLSFHTQGAVFPTQAGELLTFGGGQAVSTLATVEIGLLEPGPQRLQRDAKIA